MAKKHIVPVFGDIHGNIEGFFNTMKYIQKKYSLYPDYVLQLGDIGYFPNIPDNEEIKHPLELGFHRYLNDEKYANQFIDDSSSHFRTFFVRGNHEDQETLKSKIESNIYGSIKLDKHDKFFYLPDGRSIRIYDSSLIGLGGIDPVSRPKKYNENPLIGFSDEGLEELIFFRERIDILLTHQGPIESNKGSKEINELIGLLAPKIHLHGHSHSSSDFEISGVKSYGLSNMPLVKRPFTETNDFYGFLDLKELRFTLGSPLTLIHVAV